MIDTDHLVNQIHAQVEGVAETGFPMGNLRELQHGIHGFHHSLCLCYSHW